MSKRRVALLIESSRAYGRGLLRGVARFLREHDHWSVCFSPLGLSELPEWLAEWRGDGILARIDSHELARRLVELDLPLIDLRGALTELGLPPFGPDNRAVATAALEHFQDRGLRDFAYFGPPSNANPYDDLRSDCFRQAVAESGGTCHVFRHDPMGEREETRCADRSTRLVGWLRELPKPVGILACHDEHGHELLVTCRDSNLLVPEEVAVMGVDNDCAICDLCVPPLTSIDLNTERIGFEAAVVLDQLMDRPLDSQRSAFFPPRGVVARQSTDTLAIEDQDVATVVGFIRSQACRGISVLDVVDQVPLSQSALQRRFKQTIGRSLKAEIVRVRIERAKLLLVQTKLPVKGIALQSGFRQPKYFVETFHHRVGMTPLAFRRENGRFV